MSCHQQHGTRAYIQLIEAATGEVISQSEWHQFRVDAAEAGYQISRSRADTDDKVEVFKMLDESLQTDPDIDFNSYYEIRSSQVSPEEMLDGITVTTGTVEVVRYLSRNGARATIQRVRQTTTRVRVTPSSVNLSRFEVNTGYPFPQANSVPKLASSVDAIDAGADTDEALAMSLGVTDRQGAYYGTALGYLGLAQETSDTPRSWQLTAAGADFLNASPADRVAILSHLYEQVGEKAMMGGDGGDLSDSTGERRDMALQSCQKYLDAEGAERGVQLESDDTRDRSVAAAAHANEQKERAREAKPTTRYGDICPTCFTVMPISGVCENCE